MAIRKFPTGSSGESSASSQPAKPHRGQCELPHTIMHVRTTKTSLDYKRQFLCVLSEFELPNGRNTDTLVKEWHPVYPTAEVEVQALVGRPVTSVNLLEGIYVDEEGNVFQLLN